MWLQGLPTLDAYLRHWSNVQPTREAAVGSGQRLTWAELYELTYRWSAALAEAGVAVGDRVAVRANPSPIAFLLLLAAARVGAIFVGVNPKSSQTEIGRRLDDSTPKAYFDLARPAPDMMLTEFTPEIVVGEDEITTFLGEHRRPQSPQLNARHVNRDAQAPCALVYTSGSTGKPKGALIPQRSLLWGAITQADHWWDDRPARVLCNLPISQIAGLCDVMTFALVVGGTLIFQEGFDAGATLEVIDEEAITHWGAVPAMPYLCVANDRWAHSDLRTLRLLYWTGGKLPLAIAAEWLARTPALATAYGLTETVGSLTFTEPTRDLDVLCHTIGRPDARIEVRIADSLEGDHAIASRGEVVARSEFFISGYSSTQETATIYDADGWLHTGDLAVQRADGNYCLVGRRDEQYKSGGYNIQPAEIEDVLHEHPAVRSAAVVPQPDPVFGQVGCAFVVTNTPITSRELDEFLRPRLANYKIPKRIVRVDQLPLLPSGKIDRTALLERVNQA